VIDLCEFEQENGLSALISMLRAKHYTAQEIVDNFGLKSWGLHSGYHAFAMHRKGTDGLPLPQVARIYCFKEIENGRGKEYCFEYSR
jgi:hypothetical protein